MTALEAVVLLSIGRHPSSGRPRRADGDARALELALGLGIPVHAIHAGQADEDALRLYLGQGLDRITVLELPVDADPVPALIEHLSMHPPCIVLAGMCAESSEGSGMLPYLIAQACGAAMVPGIVSLAIKDRAAELLQALPRGRRRIVQARLPLVASVGARAPAPRQSAFAARRRGRIERVVLHGPADPMPGAWVERPARVRPKPIRTHSGASIEDRLHALTQTRDGSGRILADLSPDAAGRVILEYLVAEGILDAPDPASAS